MHSTSLEMSSFLARSNAWDYYQGRPSYRVDFIINMSMSVEMETV